MSIRSNPFEELERLFERMTRQFDEASRMWESGEPLGFRTTTGESMPVDLVERDDRFVVTVDLPGYDRDEVEIRATDRTLRIEARREEATDEETAQYLRHERRHAEIERTIRLPEDVDTDDITARMKNGVLTIAMPKRELDESREIDIE